MGFDSQPYIGNDHEYQEGNNSMASGVAIMMKFMTPYATITALYQIFKFNTYFCERKGRSAISY
jgi:hypothetical protein